MQLQGKEAPTVAPTSEYAALISAIEIPDCGCNPASGEPSELLRSLFMPCKHILAADHDLTIDEWVELLEHAFPDEYCEPELAPDVLTSMETPIRIEQMKERHQLGYAIWQPLDLGKDGFQIGRKAARGANGRATSTGVSTDNPEHDRSEVIDDSLESYYEAAADRAAMRALGKGA